MTYSTTVPKTEESLHWLVDQALALGDGQFLDAIYQKHLSTDDVLDLLDDATAWHSRLCQEVRRLNIFARDFNQQFATDHNQCFKTAELLFNRIRNSIGGAKKFYKRFCPRVYSDYGRLPWPDKEKHKPSVFERSNLANSSFSGYLFGFDTYPISVFHLYIELAGAIKDLAIGLLICRNIMKEEEIIRNTPNRLLKIYEECMEEAVTQQKGFIKSLKNNGTLELKSEIAEKMNRVKDLDEKNKLLHDLFHNCNQDDFKLFAIADQLLKGRDNHLLGLEPFLWTNNPEKALQVRCLIEHFDELDPKGLRNRDKNGKEFCLSGKSMALLMEWSESTNPKQFVEEHFPKFYKGKYGLVKYNSAQAAKKQLSEIPGAKKAFEQKVQSLLDKYYVCNNSCLTAS